MYYLCSFDPKKVKQINQANIIKHFDLCNPNSWFTCVDIYVLKPIDLVCCIPSVNHCTSPTILEKKKKRYKLVHSCDVSCPTINNAWYFFNQKLIRKDILYDGWLLYINSVTMYSCILIPVQLQGTWSDQQFFIFIMSIQINPQPHCIK